MKLKSLALLAALAPTITLPLYTQANEFVSLSNDFHYTQYNRIIDLANEKTWDLALSGSDNGTVVARNVYGHFWHGGDNQQWLVMPTYPGSDEYFIANKATGDILDIGGQENHGATNVYGYEGHAHGGENQLFRLWQPVINEYYISSPIDRNRTLDISIDIDTWEDPWEVPWTASNINFTSYHGGNNQTFAFLDSGDIPTQIAGYMPIDAAIEPDLPGEITRMNESIADEINEVIMGETVIPFPMVKNDPLLNRRLQAKESPYYKVTKSRLYKKIYDETWAKGDMTTKTQEATIGMTQHSLSEVSRMLSVTFTASAEVGFAKGAFSGSASSSFSRTLETKSRALNEITNITEEKTKLEEKHNGDMHKRLVKYRLVERYLLERSNGTKVLEWDVHVKDRDKGISYTCIDNCKY